VAISAAIYENADRLLCHDDELEGRRIAFILYMVPKEWDENDAGHLDLFNVDEKTK
jgi:prolyl 3-hydroxylase /prolyl 3,4-dihydroxylase